MEKKEIDSAKMRIPIGFKLVSMMALMLFAATITVVLTATYLFTNDKTSFVTLSTEKIAGQLADQTYQYFSHLVSELTTMTEIQVENMPLYRKDESLAQHFVRNEEIISVAEWKKGATSPERQSYRTRQSPLIPFVQKTPPSPKSWAGEVDVQRMTVNGEGVLTVSFPLTVDSNKNVIVAGISLVNPAKLIQVYGKKSEYTSYLVDKEGNVLAHPREEYVKSGANLKKVAIVREMLESTINNKTDRFMNLDGTWFLGAFRKVGVAGVGVISQVPEEKALEVVKKVRQTSLHFAGIVLFLAFSIIYFFSRTLTNPIKALVTLTREIARGNFDIKVAATGRDEITELTKSFGQMATGLAERDKLKETFNKFHSKEIAEAILSGEVKLGGNRQEATVFFSDIRSFTALSEELEAEQVVEMLNEYMTAMVQEITEYQGVVDKYVGDAIMAIWGVPIAKPDDTWRAVRASLSMRQRLASFNDERIKKGKNPIKIGMGLHTGELIAGNIGSTQKMEYTVIGDTVNTASRIESLTKEFGTDMLISDSVYEKIKDKIIVEAVSASVKGKSKVLTAYKVKGYYDDSGNQVIIETPYSSYEAGHSDKVIHNKESA